MSTRLFIAALLMSVSTVTQADPIVYEGTDGPGKGKHIVFLAGDHEYRSEESLPALARIMAARLGFKCTVLFTVDPQSGEIDPAADFMPGTETLKTADLAVFFLRFKNLPDEQMQHIADYLDRAGPVVGLRTATHAFKIPKDRKFARFDYAYKGDEYARGFGRQVLGESWSGHYGTNHVMSTRLNIVPEAKSHPIMQGVTQPWVQSGGYWTVPMDGSSVLAMAQPLKTMKQDAEPADGKKPCPGAWTREYSGADGSKGRVFTTTYGASEDMTNEDFRRMMVNACLWASKLEDAIKPDLDVNLVGGYNPVTFSFGGHRRGVKPEDIADMDSPIFNKSSAVVSLFRKRRNQKFESLFDGKTLDGWKGDPRFWSVEDGAITGRTTAENKTTGNTFCVWQGGDIADFDLEFEFRIEGHNSGLQYRSFQLGDDPFRIGGYQADFDAAKKWAGTLYGEKFRGILAKRGEQVVLKGTEEQVRTVKGKQRKRTVALRDVRKISSSENLARHIHDYPKWNTFRVVARGFVFQQFINNKLMCELRDEDKENRRDKGLLALQLHAGPPMKVQFRKIRIAKKK